MRGISVIVPIYNAENYLAETLNSLLSQTYKEWECILVNDGSTDNSLAICEQYKNKDNRFVVYIKPNEKSADIARAYGIERVKTAWIMYLDADDIIEPAYIEKMVARQQETGADIVSPTMIYSRHQLEGEIWRLPCEPIHYEDVLSGPEACANTIGGWHLTTNGMLYRTEFNTGITRGHYMNSDEFSSRQILFKANKVAFSDAQYIYRQYTNSISRNLSTRLWERMFVDLEIVNFVISHYTDMKVRKKAITTQFFNLVHLAASAYLDVSKINYEDRKFIQGEVFAAIEKTNKDALHKYLPSHRMMYTYGKRWFVFSSIIYVLIQRIRGKKYEYR